MLNACRQLASRYHADKTSSRDDIYMQELKQAKDECLKHVIERDYARDEQELVFHICTVLNKRMADECNMHLDLCSHGGDIIRHTLSKFFWICTVDVMEWTLSVGRVIWHLIRL